MTVALELRLRSALSAAMRARETDAVRALRTALAAVANAEAVDADPSAVTATSVHVAGAHAGLGAAEMSRRELDEDQVRALVAAERDERLTAADELDGHGQGEHADRLRREAAALDAVLLDGGV
jgi:uncharacterized protein YqeY